MIADDGGWRLDRSRRAALAIVLAACVLLSLMLPVATNDKGQVTDGVMILLLGWVAMFGLQFAWLANPLLAVTLPMIAAERPGRRRLRILGIALLFCAGSTLLWSASYDDAGSHPIVARHAGYYLWLAAVAGTGLAAIVLPAPETDIR